ncbi:MAG: nucleotidyltransferase family protein [Bacteroidales bacterium]|nr:nucleotidyltransferase family protein [Bacteroidales bacterium]
MKAMIFAAGLGTRLTPLTDTTPKALVKIKDQTLLEILINRLINAGFNQIIINVHHFADQVITYLGKKKYFGIRIEISDETDLLLDTGGGLIKAQWFFDTDEPFLLHNVDVISDIDLIKMRDFHLNQRSFATLAVMRRNSSRYLLVDSSNLLCGWVNTKTGEKKIARKTELLTEFAFSGIQWVNPDIFPLIIEEGRFSIIDLYLRLAETNKISVYDHSNTNWLDVGSLENLDEASSRFLHNN